MRFVLTHSHTHARVHTHTHTRAHTYPRAHTHTHTHTPLTRAHTCANANITTHVHTSEDARACECARASEHGASDVIFSGCEAPHHHHRNLRAHRLCVRALLACQDIGPSTRIGTRAHALAHARMSVDERATAWPSTQAPEITCQHIGASTSMATQASTILCAHAHCSTIRVASHWT